MSYVLAPNGVVAVYPYSVPQLRADNQEVASADALGPGIRRHSCLP